MKKLILLSLALILFAAPMADDILEEGFEGGSLPSGWDIWQEGEAGYNWTLYNNAAYAHSGSWSCYIFYTYANIDNWLVTPTLDMSGYENLDFSVWHNTVDDSFYIYAGVMVSDVASPDAGDFTELDELGVTGGTYTEFSADASAYDEESDVTFAVRYEGYAQHIHYVDDFLITGDPIVGVESASLGEIKAIYR